MNKHEAQRNFYKYIRKQIKEINNVTSNEQEEKVYSYSRHNLYRTRNICKKQII